MLWTAVKDANLLLALLLELAVYASAAWCAWTRTGRRRLKPLTALAAVTLLATVWGTFCAPAAAHPLHGPARAAVELAWYAAGLAALFAAAPPARRRTLAAAFAGALALSTAIGHI
ncbi:YrdB family protein [Streptacidiphilus rugosus]|uniref:YrdB family protein n=1 Tax=Streptacidiphilus rugosus TaxID=405783 RepID=UPI00068CC9EE|nr:YrdB family protein [Streptacidiphilus rugosus]